MDAENVYTAGRNALVRASAEANLQRCSISEEHRAAISAALVAGERAERKIDQALARIVILEEEIATRCRLGVTSACGDIGYIIVAQSRSGPALVNAVSGARGDAAVFLMRSGAEIDRKHLGNPALWETREVQIVWR